MWFVSFDSSKYSCSWQFVFFLDSFLASWKHKYLRTYSLRLIPREFSATKSLLSFANAAMLPVRDLSFLPSALSTSAFASCICFSVGFRFGNAISEGEGARQAGKCGAD